MDDLEKILDELNELTAEIKRDINDITNKVDEQWVRIFDLLVEVKMGKGEMSQNES